MRVQVTFYSYFKEVSGEAAAEQELEEGATAQDLLKALYARFPKLAAFQNSTLIARDVDYIGKSEPLKDGDEISLFPPVQGG